MKEWALLIYYWDGYTLRFGNLFVLYYDFFLEFVQEMKNTFEISVARPALSKL